MNCRMDLLSMTADELKGLCETLSEPAYRAKQLFSWLHDKRVSVFAEMTNLGAEFRNRLTQVAYIPSIETVARQISADGTEKFLFGFTDGNCVESVAMRYKHGVSVCVSSQAGCRMGCRFCASAKHGFVRNLAASEILSQVYAVSRLVDERIDSVVLMGTGEPLDNFDNVLRFISLLTDENGYNLSIRSVSLSTCGLCDRIRELADLKLGITLSVSLHAVTDEKRSNIMPVNNRYPIGELMDACKYYFAATGRRISFEYAVIDGVNDSRADAEGLAHLLKGQHAHVNLIPVNSGGDYTANGRAAAERFCAELQKLAQNATVRRTLGADIDAACGQLRNRYLDRKVNNQ